MKGRSFGFVAGPSAPRREPDLNTSEGQIEHSRQHGVIATLGAVAARGAVANAPKQAVEIVTAPNGERVVARADDIERERNRPLTKAQREARWAREQFLRETNPQREAQQHEAAQRPMARIDVGKKNWSKR